jgi:hypothetical protein
MNRNRAPAACNNLRTVYFYRFQVSGVISLCLHSVMLTTGVEGSRRSRKRSIVPVSDKLPLNVGLRQPAEAAFLVMLAQLPQNFIHVFLGGESFAQ